MLGWEKVDPGKNGDQYLLVQSLSHREPKGFLKEKVTNECALIFEIGWGGVLTDHLKIFLHPTIL